jgi:NTP pyrophosphatase (non-canonical NTP hydrolase)
MEENPDNLYNEALDAWGIDAQMDVAMEELSELIKAIIKYRRKPSEQRAMDIAEELGDVIIMSRQVEIAMERKYPTFSNWKDQSIETKLTRVRAMINDSQSNT